MKQPDENTWLEGDGERIIVRCYDTKVLSPRLVRAIRTVAGCTVWEAWQISAGIAAGQDEICLIVTESSRQAAIGKRELQAAGLMVRTELITDGGLAPSRPGRVEVLRGLAAVRLDR